MKLNPSLTYGGNYTEAFHFYEENLCQKDHHDHDLERYAGSEACVAGIRKGCLARAHEHRRDKSDGDGFSARVISPHAKRLSFIFGRQLGRG